MCEIQVKVFFWGGAYGCLVAPPLFVEKKIFPPLIFFFFCQNQLDIFVWVYFRVLYSVTLIYVYIPLLVPPILITMYIVGLHIRLSSLPLFLIFKIFQLFQGLCLSIQIQWIHSVVHSSQVSSFRTFSSSPNKIPYPLCGHIPFPPPLKP